MAFEPCDLEVDFVLFFPYFEAAKNAYSLPPRRSVSHSARHIFDSQWPSCTARSTYCIYFSYYEYERHGCLSTYCIYLSYYEYERHGCLCTTTTHEYILAVAPEGRNSAARQVLRCLDIIMAASRTDIASMFVVACLCLLRRQIVEHGLLSATGATGAVANMEDDE